ncbi:MAG: SAM-dependent methyltransferase [Carbonactinosporaceae bacterium]
MTDDQVRSAAPAGGKPTKIDNSIAHPARVYDYLLGGKDNFAPDRAAAERAYASYPGGLEGIRVHARAQRSFLSRAVHHLAGETGTRQFLDIGTGIPTADNTHQVAQRVAPESRVVYVDNDPIVLVHARALLVSSPEGRTDYIDADLRDPDAILSEAAATLDFTQPVAITLLGILHFFDDADDPYGIVTRLLQAVPPGSHLVIAHLASDVLPVMTEALKTLSQRMSVPVCPRTQLEVARFFEGLEVLGPGVVQLHRWRPGADDLAADVEVPVHCGVARKP